MIFVELLEPPPASARWTLNEHREPIVGMFKLRQANPSFWYQGEQQATSNGQWAARFQSRVKAAVNRLDNLETENTLNDLFENLSVVRNQIVHGGSAGFRSRGRTQVFLGAALLDALIPRFRDSIRSNLEDDWESPPFPRLGAGPDDECPPPWLEAGRTARLSGGTNDDSRVNSVAHEAGRGALRGFGPGGGSGRGRLRRGGPRRARLRSLRDGWGGRGAGPSLEGVDGASPPGGPRAAVVKPRSGDSRHWLPAPPRRPGRSTGCCSGTAAPRASSRARR